MQMQYMVLSSEIFSDSNGANRRRKTNVKSDACTSLKRTVNMSVGSNTAFVLYYVVRKSCVELHA